MSKLGIALSGGGSRAMAFHRGTMTALHEIGLTDSIDVVSTVSGGSIFGAAWVCSRLERKGTEKFLDDLVPVLRRGFVCPALLSLRALKILLPGRNRTHRLAEVFDDRLLGHRRLDELPERPLLCLNAAVLNHAMPGRFSRGGFSCAGVGTRTASGSYPEQLLPNRSLGFAVAASAAFPFALPPLALDRSELLPLHGTIADHRRLYLTDGGVLENLGVERLLSSGRFAATNIIVSDAGVAESAWSPTLWQRITSFGAYALSRQTLSRLLTLMNDKQNKTMRQLLMGKTVAIENPPERRNLWFIRIDQTWETFFEGVSEARRLSIARGGEIPSKNEPAASVVAFLQHNGVDLTKAKEYYDARRADCANSVQTNLTGLTDEEIEALRLHAMWQVHACRAVYGEIL